MRPGSHWQSRSTMLVLFLGCAAPLFFRFFITVDGPMHVLHASVLEQAWTTPRYVADGVAYDTDKLDVGPGDLLLMVLLHLSSPETCHAMYAVFVTIALIASITWFMRAQGHRPDVALLWLAPFVLSFILVMGFLHFILGVAVAFSAVAWQRSRLRSPLGMFLGSAAGLVLAWYTHRSAPMLLALLFIVTIVPGHRSSSTSDAKRSWHVRNSALLVGLAMVAASLLILMNSLNGENAYEAHRDHTLAGWSILRPLILLDPLKEGPVVLALSGIFLLAMVAGMVIRWRSGRRVDASDPWLILAIGFAFLPAVMVDPRMDLLFVAERSQWLALLFAVVWLATLQAGATGWAKRIIVIASLSCVPLHAWRLIALERTLAGLEAPHKSMLKALPALGSGNTIVPVMAEDNWLLQHLGAFLTIRHDGISFTRKDHLNFTLDDPPIEAVKGYLRRMSTDRMWLPRHQRGGKRPHIDRIVFIGNDARLRDLWLRPWRKHLEQHYYIGFDDGYTRVYALKEKGER